MAAERRSIHDAELVRQAQAGDRAAFGHLLDRHGESIRALLAAWPVDGAAAERLELAAGHRAYRYLDRFDSLRAFRPWLFKIVVNLLFADERERGRMQTRRSGSAATAVSPPSKASPPELRPSPDPFLPRLRPLPRAIVILHEILGMRIEEIAESLAIPSSVVGERLEAARRETATSGSPGARGRGPKPASRSDPSIPGPSLLDRVAAQHDLDAVEAAWIRPRRDATAIAAEGRRRTRAIYGGVALAAIIAAVLLVVLLGVCASRP